MFLAVLPLAIAASASPTKLAAQLVILGLPDGLRRSWLYAFGFVVGALIVFLVIAFGATSVRLRLPRFDDDLVAVLVRWICAALLVGLAAVVWSKHRRDLRLPAGSRKAHRDEWAARLVDARGQLFFGLGIGTMLVNASSIIVLIPAIHLIIRAQQPLIAEGLALAMLFAFTVAVAVVPPIVFGGPWQKPKEWLRSFSDTVRDHSAAITVVICLAAAAYLAYLGWISWEHLGVTG